MKLVVFTCGLALCIAGAMVGDLTDLIVTAITLVCAGMVIMVGVTVVWMEEKRS